MHDLLKKQYAGIYEQDKHAGKQSGVSVDNVIKNV